MKTLRILSFFLLMCVGVVPAFSGDRISLPSLGMGRTAVAFTRGTDAIGINPANLAIPDKGLLNISLIQTDARISTNLFTYDIYQKYFTGTPDSSGKRVSYPLTDADKNYINSQLPDYSTTRINVESMLAGISLQMGFLGSFGFAVIEHAGNQINLSRNYFEFYFEGFPDNTNYNFDGTSLNAWWYSEYNISYARKLPIHIPFIHELYVGAGFKMIQGYGIFTSTNNNTYLTNTTTDDIGIHTIKGNANFTTQRAGADFLNSINLFTNDSAKSSQSFTPFPTPVGKGTGFDLGATAELNEGLIVSWSVTDIGKITWDKNIIQTNIDTSFVFTGVSNTLGDSLKNVFKGKNQPGSSFVTNLPTVMRLGAVIDGNAIPVFNKIPGHFLLAFEYAQGFNESLGNTTKARFSFGTEYRLIPLIPIRTGLVLGGDEPARWAFGFGIDFWVLDFNFATDNFGMVFSPKNFNAVSLGFGLKVRI